MNGGIIGEKIVTDSVFFFGNPQKNIPALHIIIAVDT